MARPRQIAREFTLTGMRGLAAFAVILLTVALWGPMSGAHAQTVSPDLIQKFEQLQQGGQGPVTTPSPLDQSRQQMQQPNQSTTNYPQMTPQQMEEQQALKEEKAKYSALEVDYQKRANAYLTQYGYDVFDKQANQSEIVTGRVPDDYILGVGDEVVVTFQGSTAKSVTVPVDREGRIVLEDLPPINAAGRSFADVRKEIKQRTKEVLIGTDAFVSVGALRMISVYVVGEVYQPGLYRLTSLATVLEALNAASGVKKTGSLRRITVHRGKKVEAVDLYHLFAGSGSSDVALHDGDRIVVPTIGPTAAVSGPVVRPGIYELSPKTTAGDLLKLAGGSLRAAGYSLLLNHIENSGRAIVSGVKDRTRRIAAGDILSVFFREGGDQGAIEVLGHVRSPGRRSLAEVPTLKDLLPDPSALKDYPYLLFGVIETVDPETYAPILKPFSPKKVMFGSENIRLHDKDRVFLFGRDDIDFLSSNIMRRTVITGSYDVREVANVDTPGAPIQPEVCKPLEQLAKIVNDTRSERFAAAIRAVYIQLDATQTDLVGHLETTHDERLSQIKELSDADNAKLDKLEQVSKAGLTDRVPQVDKEKEQMQRIQDQDNPNCPSIYSKARNLLPFVLEYVASVDGAVRAPGVYPITNNTSLSALAAAASGTTNNVDLTNIEVLNYHGAPKAGKADFARHYVNASDVDLSKVTVNAGSGVRFNSLFVPQEPGGVLLSGEVRRPGVYTIRRGETLSELIKRAGGLTDQAYPYGAVFTRERVRQAQQEGLKRTEREINMGLATAALKQHEFGAGALAAAQQLAEKISSVPTIGRVVIEADPRVLATHPDLDTVLEPGDKLFVPKRPNYIMVLGDTLNPGALQFTPGKSVRDYIDESGGIQKTADDGRIFVVMPNGVAKPVKFSSWGFSNDVLVPPGTSIVVPKDLEPIDTIMLVKDLSQIFSQLAVSAASIAVITR